MKTQLEALITRLEDFNTWRQGADSEQPNPTQIGQDINMAITELKGINITFSDEELLDIIGALSVAEDHCHPDHKSKMETLLSRIEKTIL